MSSADEFWKDLTRARYLDAGDIYDIAGNGHRVIVLNKEKSLNALNLDMVKQLTHMVQSYESSKVATSIFVRGLGKAFCAGGDVVSICHAGRAGKDTRSFFWHEYRLNELTSRLATPYVAVLDGFTMGGGVGISVHGRYRVATERSVFAMPETGIGFFPDVGGSYFLPRLDGHLGMFLGLTGARLHGADLFHANIATHFIPSGRLPLVHSYLSGLQVAGDEPIQATLNSMHDHRLPPFSLAPHLDAIERCFKHDSVEDIMAALRREGTDWSKKVLATLEKASPTSLKVTHRLLSQPLRGLRDCLRQEFTLSQNFMKGGTTDFYAGVDALLISKTGKPQWYPRTLAEVSDHLVDEYFKPVEVAEPPKAADEQFQDTLKDLFHDQQPFRYSPLTEAEQANKKDRIIQKQEDVKREDGAKAIQAYLNLPYAGPAAANLDAYTQTIDELAEKIAEDQKYRYKGDPSKLDLTQWEEEQLSPLAPLRYANPLYRYAGEQFAVSFDPALQTLAVVARKRVTLADYTAWRAAKDAAEARGEVPQPNLVYEAPDLTVYDTEDLEKVAFRRDEFDAEVLREAQKEKAARRGEATGEDTDKGAAQVLWSEGDASAPSGTQVAPVKGSKDQAVDALHATTTDGGSANGPLLRGRKWSQLTAEEKEERERKARDIKDAYGSERYPTTEFDSELDDLPLTPELKKRLESIPVRLTKKEVFEMKQEELQRKRLEHYKKVLRGEHEEDLSKKPLPKASDYMPQHTQFPHDVQLAALNDIDVVRLALERNRLSDRDLFTWAMGVFPDLQPASLQRVGITDASPNNAMLMGAIKHRAVQLSQEADFPLFDPAAMWDQNGQSAMLNLLRKTLVRK